MKPFPDKKYQIILADPPWKYRQGKSMGTQFQGACDRYYNTMDINELCKLRIADITDKDCILFLWATFPQLVEALQLIKAWGFEYKTLGFNWIKLNKDGTPFFGVGYYTKSNGEICLLATKGNPHKFIKDNSISQIIMTQKRKHSSKPTNVREKIVQLLGDRPRIELFARGSKEKDMLGYNEFEGWDVWGNEV